ncbi:MAG: hypothetical protein KJ706_09115, partial [Candidatus Omnitrophica bacterium]|nr:hypothetical protein [Candidatus Omnitrophota bacterium]
IFEPRKGTAMPELSKNARSLRNITDDMVAKIQRIEKKLKIKPFSKTYYYHLSPCIEAWMRNEEFDRLLRYTDVDEGEIIRNFRMAIQILREILDTPATKEFKDKVQKSIHLINRGIIDAEKQLRT